jgi:site-specific recombinase XerD
MYKTGCRHSELLPCLWQSISESEFLLSCKKHSEERIIQKTILSNEEIDIIENKKNSSICLDRSTLSRAFNYLTYPYRFFIADSQLILHSFRHNYIKNLISQGLSIADVKAEIGHKQTKNTLSYVESIIKTIII